VEFTDQPEMQKKVEEKYKELRKQLTGGLPPPFQPDASIEQPEKPEAPEKPRDNNRFLPGMDDQGNLVEPSSNPPTDSGATDALFGPKADEKNSKRAELNLDQFAVALKHGQHLEKLSPEDQGRFAELMLTAEQRLREGQYFLAERRFERALRFIPGHPLATVGIAHSQLGSGLYLSAAATLRTLLARQPELIDVTYGPDVLPDRERLLENVATIKQRLEAVRDLDSYAFLLAYLGHQLGDRALVEQGLNRLDSLAPSDSLAKLLRGIWLDGEVAPAAPATDPGK
jgi:tetratricopeptide (TPR) repeat protein